MPATFPTTLPPQEEPSGDIHFAVTEVRFGEGYAQSWGEGLNDKQQDWPMTYVGTDAEIAPILAFLDAQKGYISFYWTPPNGTQGLYRAKRYGYIPAAAGNAKVSVLFEQRFGP